MSTLWSWGVGEGLGPAALPSPRTQKVAYARMTMAALQEKQKGKPKVRPVTSAATLLVPVSLPHTPPSCSPLKESTQFSSWLSSTMR